MIARQYKHTNQPQKRLRRLPKTMGVFMNTKQHIVALLFAVLSFSAFAQYIGPKDNTVTTVLAARKAIDSTPVSIEGYIVRQLRNNQFQFKDATGSISVAMQKDIVWPKEISENDLVRITGKINRGIVNAEINIDRVELVTAGAQQTSAFSPYQ